MRTSPCDCTTGPRPERIDSEHLITLGQRGIPDAEVVEHLAEGDVVLLTQDREFEYLPLRGGKVIISRVSQSVPIERRIEIWLGAELTVARLVVQGLTSREVAESMFVSTRTVEAHVRHIYRKFGVNSRRELRELASQIPELGPFDT